MRSSLGEAEYVALVWETSRACAGNGRQAVANALAGVRAWGLEPDTWLATMARGGSMP